MRRIAGLFLLIVVLAISEAAAQPRFFHLTSSEGLSNDHVNAVAKGRHGFMWIATDDGLNRYDGYQFIIYRHDRDNPNSIRDNLVYDIYEKEGQFWIATASGLDVLHRESDKFLHVDLN